jgi:hypothetical protein
MPQTSAPSIKRDCESLSLSLSEMFRFTKKCARAFPRKNVEARFSAVCLSNAFQYCLFIGRGYPSFAASQEVV